MKRHLLKGDVVFDRVAKADAMIVTEPDLIPGQVKIFDLSSKTEKFIAFDEIRIRIAAGTIEIRRNGEPDVTPSETAEGEDAAIGVALRFVTLISEEVRQSGRSILQCYAELLEQFKAGKLELTEFPSQAAAYRYLARYRNGLSILSTNACKGNRTPRYDTSIVDMVTSNAKNLYLKPKSKFTLPTLTEYINQVAHDETLLPKHKKISQKYVKRIVNLHLTRDVEKERMDPKDVIAGKAVATNRIRVPAPFMRVEQDGVHIPMELKTRYGLSKDVWLIHAIDCCTSMPVGWRLVIGATTVSNSLACIETILFSKKPRLKELGLKYDFDCYGTPSLLVFDNGGENKGGRMQKLTQLGIDPMYCRAREANGKPFIERLNGSLKRSLETLAGSTRMDGKDGARDPAQHGDIPETLEQFEVWLVRWYFEEWANTVLERHVRSVFVEETWMGPTPALRWKAFSEGMAYAMTLPPSMDSWRRIRYEHCWRTLSRKTGITFEDHHFRGANLKTLIEMYGEVSVEVLFDLDDFRRVRVPTANGEQLLELTNIDVDETTPAYSFARAKEILAETRGKHPESEARALFRRDVFRRSIESSPGTSPRPKTAAQASKITTKLAKEAAAVERAKQSPLPARPATTGADSTVTTVIDLDDAPVLQVFNRKSGALQ